MMNDQAPCSMTIPFPTTEWITLSYIDSAAVMQTYVLWVNPTWWEECLTIPSENESHNLSNHGKKEVATASQILHFNNATADTNTDCLYKVRLFLTSSLKNSK